MKKYILALLPFIALFISTPSLNAAGIRYIDPIFPEVDTTYNITYSQIDGTNLQLDLYQPKNDTLAKRPAIVWIHSGGFYTGKKEDISSLAIEFAKRGYVTISINYRLSNFDYLTNKSLDLSQIKNTPGIMNVQYDAQTSVRWLRANSAALRIDPNMIFAAGGSAGAVTSLLLGYNSEMTPINREYSNESVKVSGAVAIMGVTDPAMVQPGEPPVIMFNGGLDTIIRVAWVNAFQKQIEAMGIQHEFYWYPNAAHGQVPEATEVIPKTAQFLAKIVTPSAGLPLGDLNSDGHVDIVDVGIIIDDYGKTSPTNPKSDINGDGVVNIVDIGILLDHYGQ